MAEARAIDNQVFELQVKNLKEHVNAHDKINDAKFDRIEALIAKNLSEQKELIGEIRGKVRGMESRISRIEDDINGLRDNIKDIRGDIKALKIELSDVKSDIKVINAIANVNTTQNKFVWNFAWMCIIMGLVLAIVQHFWK